MYIWVLAGEPEIPPSPDLGKKCNLKGWKVIQQILISLNLTYPDLYLNTDATLTPPQKKNIYIFISIAPMEIILAILMLA